MSNSRVTKPSKPRKDRQGKHCMVLELEPADRDKLDSLVKRYEKLVAKPSKAWVLRQLIRHANKATKLQTVLTIEE